VPVIGVIMMIAIVVIIAAVVAAFAYGIIGGVNKAPSAALVVEGVKAGNGVEMKVFHHGGDTITGAFKAGGPGSTIGGMWSNIEIRVNGATVNNTASGVGHAKASNMGLNDVAYLTGGWDTNFNSGDMLNVTIDTLATEDTIILLHTPSDSILQRVTVM
jgi:FlaG/FlaF family flagellin (archaellin)